MRAALPAAASRSRIKAATSLTPKDKDAAKADVAQVVGGTLMLGFSKDLLKLSPDDKEIAFATTIGKMAIKTSSPPRAARLRVKRRAIMSFTGA